MKRIHSKQHDPILKIATSIERAARCMLGVQIHACHVPFQEQIGRMPNSGYQEKDLEPQNHRECSVEELQCEEVL